MKKYYDRITRYNAKNTKQYTLRLNKKTDKDVIAKLDSVPSKQGYVKVLIRNDLH